MPQEELKIIDCSIPVIEDSLEGKFNHIYKKDNFQTINNSFDDETFIAGNLFLQILEWMEVYVFSYLEDCKAVNKSHIRK